MEITDLLAVIEENLKVVKLELTGYPKSEGPNYEEARKFCTYLENNILHLKCEIKRKVNNG